MKTLLIIFFITSHGDREATVQHFPTYEACKAQLHKEKQAEPMRRAYCIKEKV